MSLRARLLLSFLISALVPFLALTIVVFEQIDQAHSVLVRSPGVENSLESALIVSKTTLRRTEATLHGLVADWAKFLGAGRLRPPVRASIAATLRSAGVDFAQIYERRQGGWRLVEQVDLPGVLAPEPVDLSGDVESALSGDGTVRSARGALGAVARLGPDWAVLAADRVPPDFFERVDAAARGVSIYRRIGAYSEVSRGVLRLWALMLCLVLALVSAWLGTRFAAQLTRPVSELAAALERVAGGDLAVRVDPAGAREVKQVGAAFNQMAGRLSEARSQLARAEREAAWRSIARRVAHEIKNPLTPMRLSLHRLEKRLSSVESAERPAVRESLQAMLTEVENLTRLAEQFSDYARLPEPTFGPVDLAARARAACSLHQWPGIALDLSTPETPVWVHGDVLLLDRMLHNLLLNACEAMPDGGSVQVRLGTRDGRAVLEVEDRGMGMSDEVKSRVFEPYFSTKARGSGLGLAITRDIVAQHGGQLELESELGQGTTFRVRLPLANGPLETGRKEPPR